MTCVLAEGIKELGHVVKHEHFFDTLAVDLSYNADELIKHAESVKVNLRKLDLRTVGVSLDETVTKDDLVQLLHIFAKPSTADSFRKADLVKPKMPNVDEIAQRLQINNGYTFGIPDQFRRKSQFMTHPVFHQHHCETEMLRYISRLQAKDLSLANAMIPLGSCTMKLNATTEMLAVTWPEFANIHPFVPSNQAEGYHIMLQVCFCVLYFVYHVCVLNLTIAVACVSFPLIVPAALHYTCTHPKPTIHRNWSSCWRM